jgi:ABC-2 type transport system ATP-binding protein
MAAIEVEGVSFTYPARRHQPSCRALDDVSLRVPRGEMVALLGPNGSGKSTLMRIISALLAPHAGRVAILGESQPASIRSHIGVVFQAAALDRHLTVMENLRDQAALFGMRGPSARQRIARELNDAGLADRAGSLVKSLSGGLTRRADLIRALLHDPAVLLLDEPTVSLDPAAREQFLRTVEERRAAQSMTVLISTHLIDEADRCDRVVLMHHGRVVADDAPQALRRQLGSMRVTIAPQLGAGGGEPPRIEGVRWSRSGSGGGGWSASLDGDSTLAPRVAALLADAGIAFSIAPPTLADLFEQLTGSRLVGGDDSDAAAREPQRDRRRARAT